MKNTTYKLSKEGFQKLQLELEELSGSKREKAVARLALARAMGDLSENSEYSAAKEDLSMLDGRIAEIKQIVSNVEIIEELKNSSVVQLGYTVEVESNGEKTVYKIVGELEADITAGKISDTSPIGKALLGAIVGDVVTVETPAGAVSYKILKIS